MISYATEQDIKQFFKFRNLEEAIELSALQKSVGWDEHRIWYAQAIKQENILLFLIQSNSGMLRFDKDDNNAIVSIYLSPEYRSKGLAVVCLNQAMREVLKRWSINRFIAYVRVDNKPSLRLFSKLGFIRAGIKDEIIRMESL